MTQDERDYERAWHLDKKVPIALIVTIAIQTAGIIWFAAGLFYRVDALEKQTSGYLPHADRITRMEVKIENVERGVTRIESLIQAPRSQWRAPASSSPPPL